jgi:hypothetical protein
MSICRRILAASLLLAYGIPGFANPSSTSVGSDQAQKEKRECRSTMITGTRFTKRLCNTPSEWKKIEEAAQSYLRDAQSKTNKPAPQ